MAIPSNRGHVPHFTMRPHPGVLFALIICLVCGLLLALSFFSHEEGTGEYSQKGIATLIITAIVTILLTFVATSKMWFTHLWKKNSTHNRHKQHTQHHPAVKEEEYRQQRR